MRLISLNMENDRHMDRIVPFLLKENPDVICLQELYEEHLDSLRNKLGMKDGTYLASSLYEGHTWGIGILSRYPFQNTTNGYYYKPDDKLLPWNSHESQLEMNYRMRRGIVSADIPVNGSVYRIVTTHFTWSGKAENSAMQREYLPKLFEMLNPLGEYILCGDFNIPRGTELWNEITKTLKDNIPADVTTTIDQQLHKVRGLHLVIDGLFSTPKYEVRNVRVISGVSDHCAIEGDISVHGS